MSFTVVSLFAGCGGSSLGYELAGGQVLLAVENNENAVNTYHLNHPKTKLINNDICLVTGEEILNQINLKVGELDILDGSPPCQGFSMSGARKLGDARNRLFEEYCRLLTEIQPKCFVMENVAGMIKGNMKFIFVEILKTLKKCGYRVKAELLNAKNYNVPQSRERLIFIGIRNDLNQEPTFPKGSIKNITVREAFQGCPDDKRIKLTGWLSTIVSKIKQGENASKYHPKKSYFSTYRVAWDKPSPTICKTFSNILHPEIDESISIAEVKRLFTFPDSYQFTGSFENQWSRLGNCVPPNLTKAVAQHIYKNVLQKQVDLAKT
jgi:DNA (cytosine-5)-methyltransferase 1